MVAWHHPATIPITVMEIVLTAHHTMVIAMAGGIMVMVIRAGVNAVVTADILDGHIKIRGAQSYAF